MSTLLAAFLVTLFITYLVLSITAKIHGVVLCFRKKWYLGVAALMVPFFAEIVSVAKVVFKKDLLK